jgi:hypothetical protein
MALHHRRPPLHLRNNNRPPKNTRVTGTRPPTVDRETKDATMPHPTDVTIAAAGIGGLIAELDRARRWFGDARSSLARLRAKSSPIIRCAHGEHFAPGSCARSTSRRPTSSLPEGNQNGRPPGRPHQKAHRADSRDTHRPDRRHRRTPAGHGHARTPGSEQIGPR